MARLSWINLSRQLLLVSLCLLFAIACNPNPSKISNDKTLTVATEAAFPPFESKGQSGELEGFDMDLIRAIAAEAGWDVTIQNLPFDGIIPSLQTKKIDGAISAITITPARLQTVSFSRPYFKAGLAIAVRNDNKDITTLDSLKNKTIAVQIGTTGAEKAKTIPGAKVKTFDSAPLALQELSNGNADAVINDAPVTLYAIKTGSLNKIKVVGELLTEEFYGIATPKDSPKLDTINKGLGTIIQNGKYAQLYQKWFNSPPPELPESAPLK